MAGIGNVIPTKKIDVNGLDKYNRIKGSTNVIFHIVFIALSLLCVIPVLFVVSISLSAESSISQYGYRLIPRVFSAEG